MRKEREESIRQKISAKPADPHNDLSAGNAGGIRGQKGRTGYNPSSDRISCMPHICWVRDSIYDDCT